MPYRFQPLRSPMLVVCFALFAAVHVFGQSPPFVHTQAAAPTGTPTALNGMLVANNFPTASWFQWGTSTNYGSVAAVIDIFADSKVHRVSAPISGPGKRPDLPFPARWQQQRRHRLRHGPVFRVEAASAKLAACGANADGQCTIPSGNSNLVALVGSYSGSIALRADGTLAFWGTNPPGLADLAATVTNIVAVSASYAHLLALDTGGEVSVTDMPGSDTQRYYRVVLIP